MRTFLRIGVIGLLLLIPAVVSAFGDHDSTRVVVHSKDALPPEVRAELYRTFSGLGESSSIQTAYDPIVVPTVFLADSIVEKRNYAHALQEKVVEAQRFLESLDALSEIELPVGVVKAGGAVDYSILIDRMTFNTQGAIMEVYVSLALPQSGDKIAFNGKIPLSKEGGIAGSAKVFLLGDHILKLGSTMLIIKGTTNTYVEFDCNGFKGVSIEAEVQFSRDLIVPEDAKGQPKGGDERVKVSFTTYAQSLNDLMVGVSIPPFQVAGLKGFGITVQNAFMDWSDLANPPGMAFPEGYVSPFLEAGQTKLWQGFYLQKLEIRLPPSFTKDRKDKTRIALGVEQMILDDQGFTGKVFATNLVQAGDMSGWGYTLDKLGVQLVTNQIRGFEIAGRMTIPVIKAKDGKPTQFGYLAQRGADGNYIFSVSVENSLKFPLFVADLTLYKGTSVTVKEKDNKFYPSATLNGELSISALSKGPKATFNAIRFEGMVISSEAPYFKPGNFGFGKEGSSSSSCGYPVVINNIMVKSVDDRVGLGFDLTINIGGKSEDEGFGGTAALTVWGKREQEAVAEGETPSGGSGNWKFDKIELSGIGVSIKKPGVIELAGMIRFFDEDPIYGEGFKGSLDGKIQMITLQAEALFGKTPEFRYWYADALVKLESGIPIAPGISAYGFGGGYYSKMKQSTEGTVGGIGTTKSGITYVPDASTIGIKALVMIGTSGRPDPFNGEVSLEVVLNTHGGINSVTFKGSARFMSPSLGQDLDKMKEMASAAVKGNKALEKLMELLQGQVYGSVMMQYDNVNNVFHGNLEIYVNVLGGIVRGVSPGNKAGWATIHFSSDEWYILVGTPDQPIGLEVARILKAKSYFMLGKNLPGSPPPPPQVSEILGGIDLDYMRDLNALESGTGFAFGMSFVVDTGDLRFLMFYGRFAAGTGFDIMLKNYGKQYHCEGSTDPIGINGWYANGQSYAFVMGKIGIRVNLRFYKGDFDIISVGAAAVMQAKGPNPFWMRGIVGGYYRILGGLIKGNCKFQVTVGKDCKIVGPGNALENVKIISSISPNVGDKNVDVFTAPQAAFSIPIEEEFEVTDFENKNHIYRGHLKSFEVLDGTTSIEGTVRWNNDNDVAAFDSRDVFPPKKELKARISVTFEEKFGTTWKVVTNDGQLAEEVMETTFTSGDAPDYIPLTNVEYAYPSISQYNFYPKEYGQGFIMLKKGQPYLFTLGPEWQQKVHLSDVATENYVETDLTYTPAEKRVGFALPDGLIGAKAYRFEILNIPIQNQVLDANVKKTETNVATGGGEDEDAGEMTITTKNIEGNLALRDVKSVYASFFRTSKYATFLDKMRSLTLSQALSGNPGNNVLILGAYWRGDEYFDGMEIGTGEHALTERFINLEADLSNTPWYEQQMYPLVYQEYPLSGSLRVRNRNVDLLGVPPVRDLYLQQDKNDLRLTEAGDVPDALSYFSGSRIEYQLPLTMFSDYYDLQQQAANYFVYSPGTASSKVTSLLVNPYPIIDYGSYKVKLTYRIPGINLSTSSYNAVLVYSRTSGSN